MRRTPFPTAPRSLQQKMPTPQLPPAYSFNEQIFPSLHITFLFNNTFKRILPLLQRSTSKKVKARLPSPHKRTNPYVLNCNHETAFELISPQIPSTIHSPKEFANQVLDITIVNNYLIRNFRTKLTSPCVWKKILYTKIEQPKKI